jgi:uncharacterized membrane protein
LKAPDFRHPTAWAVLLTGIFAAVFLLISLVNHYLFRTSALDLGMFNHAIYHFSRFEMNTFMTGLSEDEVNYFGDHFSPLTALLSPLRYLFGTYTLLIIQALSAAWGGWGIWRYASLRFGADWGAFLLTFHFFLLWGIYSALAFDFHTNVLAAMAVPWLALFHWRSINRGVILISILILLAKENMALWLAFLMLALHSAHKKNRISSAPKRDTAISAAALVWSAVVAFWLMPGIHKGVGTDQLARYAGDGGSLFSTIWAVIKQPSLLWDYLFSDPNGHPEAAEIKWRFHTVFFLSGGFALLLRPAWLLAAMPVLAWKFLSTDKGMWDISGQYSIEFVPLISLALVGLIAASKAKTAWVIWPMVILIASTVHQTVKNMDGAMIAGERRNVMFYQKRHYHSPHDVVEINQIIRQIPPAAVVSASAELVPHLSFRQRIFQFPIVKDAEIIVLIKQQLVPYPLEPEAHFSAIEKLRESSNWQVKEETADLILFVRAEVH